MTTPKRIPNDVKWDAQDALREAQDQLKQLEELIEAHKKELPLAVLVELPEIVGRQYRTVRFLEKVLRE